MHETVIMESHRYQCEHPTLEPLAIKSDLRSLVHRLQHNPDKPYEFLTRDAKRLTERIERRDDEIRIRRQRVSDLGAELSGAGQKQKRTMVRGRRRLGRGTSSQGSRHKAEEGRQVSHESGYGCA